jgi:hypothetical protein
MPPARAVTKPQDDGIVVAIETGYMTLPDGAEHFIRQGSRLHASNPCVRHAPSWFAPADLDDYELAEERRKRLVAVGLFIE